MIRNTINRKSQSTFFSQKKPDIGSGIDWRDRKVEEVNKYIREIKKNLDEVKRLLHHIDKLTNKANEAERRKVKKELHELIAKEKKKASNLRDVAAEMYKSAKDIIMEMENKKLPLEKDEVPPYYQMFDTEPLLSKQA